MKQTLPESILQLLWKEHSRYLPAQPKLNDGTPITIISPGEHNEHRGGPDFIGGKIGIDGMVLFGDIEIHRDHDDWQKHNHAGDANYSQVILHVVHEFDEDAELKPPNIPTLVLKENLDFSHRHFWQELFEKHYARSPELPCFPHNLSVPMKLKRKLIDKMSAARLDELVARYDITSKEKLLSTVYEGVLDALGYSENREPMKALASILSRDLLMDIRKRERSDSLESIFEALFLGASGLLLNPSGEFTHDVNEYLIDLKAHWNALQASYPITETLSESDWAFFRIRPLNTPYRRIALAAALAAKYFSRDDFSIYEEIDYEIGNTFWMMRTSFKSLLDAPHSLLGSERKRAIHLNVIMPARIAASLSEKKRTVNELRSEWSSLRSDASARYIDVIEQELLEGEKINTVGAEQGALMLHRNFCLNRRCNECPVGERLIGKGLMQ